MNLQAYTTRNGVEESKMNLRWLLLAILLLLSACSQTSAPTIEEPNLSPQAVITVGGSCSLINAIRSANEDRSVGGCPAGSGADTLHLRAGATYTLNEVNNSTDGPNGLPSVTSEIVIEGSGATIQRSYATDTPSFRLFHVAAGGALTLTGVTVRNGDATIGQGGGIYNLGDLFIENSAVVDNEARFIGGGIYSRNGIVELRNSTVNGNRASFAGGIIDSRGILTISRSIIDNNSGGAISSNGSLAITHSTISNNDAGTTLSLEIGRNATIENSTISGNTGWQAIYLNFGHLEITNSTVSGNSGGILVTGRGTLDVNLSTITNNDYGIDNNEYYGDDDYDGTIHLYNSIIANQRSSSDCSGPIISRGFNLDSDGSCNLDRSLGDLPTTDPKLGSLQDNGGPTKTHGLLIDSPAVNAGDPGFSSPPRFDQRGSGFPRVAHGRLDMGAYEQNTNVHIGGCGGVLWEVLKNIAVYIDFLNCEITPDPCVLQGCEVPPEIWLIPVGTLHYLRLDLTVARGCLVKSQLQNRCVRRKPLKCLAKRSSLVFTRLKAS